MQIRVLEQELEKLGGTIPEGDVLFRKAKEEKERLELLIDNAEEIELAQKLAAEEAVAREREEQRQAEVLAQ